MNTFIGPDFMLTNDTAIQLYHDHAEGLPIIDYHCHLDPQTIAENHRFRGITEAWLGGDHYKWRAMRWNGIPEAYITGDKDDYDKFSKWAETVPYTMRNPLYHWTHMELSRLFGIDKTLSPATCSEIYAACNERLATDDFRPQSLMRRCNVRVVCTTDDPADTLEWHERIASSGFEIRVLPTWRPDRLLAVDQPTAFNAYIDRLSAAASTEIGTYDQLMEALHRRHDFFAAHGCRLSDHGLDTFPADNYTESDLRRIFAHIRSGKALNPDEMATFRSGMLTELAAMDAEKGWTQQFHVGPVRNPNSRMFEKLGPDTGYDAIDDKPIAASGFKFLDRLERRNALAKTILYNLNPKDCEVMAAMAGSFNDGSIAGKMQYGAAWWFLDQERGIRRQLDTLSEFGLLGRFVGMLTDSRSFLSYPRHEYFRRILCDQIGADIESGRLPRSEMAFIGTMIEGICYRNAESYFGFDTQATK